MYHIFICWYLEVVVRNKCQLDVRTSMCFACWLEKSSSVSQIDRLLPSSLRSSVGFIRGKLQIIPQRLQSTLKMSQIPCLHLGLLRINRRMSAPLILTRKLSVVTKLTLPLSPPTLLFQVLRMLLRQKSTLCSLKIHNHVAVFLGRLPTRFFMFSSIVIHSRWGWMQQKSRSWWTATMS